MPDRLAEIAYRLSVGIVTLKDTDYLLRLVKAAEAGLMHYWSIQTCPCGARIESPLTHPHVGGCPVGTWLRFVEEP